MLDYKAELAAIQASVVVGVERADYDFVVEKWEFMNMNYNKSVSKLPVGQNFLDEAWLKYVKEQAEFLAGYGWTLDELDAEIDRRFNP